MLSSLLGWWRWYLSTNVFLGEKHLLRYDVKAANMGIDSNLTSQQEMAIVEIATDKLRTL